MHRMILLMLVGCGAAPDFLTPKYNFAVYASENGATLSGYEIEQRFDAMRSLSLETNYPPLSIVFYDEKFQDGITWETDHGVELRNLTGSFHAHDDWWDTSGPIIRITLNVEDCIGMSLFHEFGHYLQYVDNVYDPEHQEQIVWDRVGRLLDEWCGGY